MGFEIAEFDQIYKNLQISAPGSTIKQMKHYDVPFVENPNDKCVPATIGMVLNYFMPEKKFDMSDFIQITGYIPGQGTWSAESMINLARMGYETRWIEDFDNSAFIKDPEAYLETILDKEAFNWQVTNSDLRLEADRIRRYLEAGNTIEHRKGTQGDIKQLLDDGWLVRLEVDANTLAGIPGYEGHSVLVIGYDENGVLMHNPDGVSGNKKNKFVDWKLLDQAWKNFGGSYSIYAFRRQI